MEGGFLSGGGPYTEMEAPCRVPAWQVKEGMKDFYRETWRTSELTAQQLTVLPSFLGSIKMMTIRAHALFVN